MHQELPKKRFSSVPLNVILFLSWRNLTSKKLRSSLTVVGIIIGIGAIFFLLSLGLGLQNLVTKEVVGNKSIRSVDVSTPNSRIIKLTPDNVEKIKNLSQVEKIGVSYSFAGSLKFNNSEVDTITYGVDEAYQDLSDFQVEKGRLIGNDERSSAYVSSALLSAIGIDDSSKIIDQAVELSIPIKTKEGQDAEVRDKFTIVGVINAGSGSEIYLSKALFDQAGVEQYSQAKLVAKDGADVTDLRNQIQSFGFETVSPIDTIDQINQIFKYFNVILVGFGAIGMIVAVLGMFNTLTISLLERTREIGLMIALGGRKKDMRLLFTFEALLLSGIGAIIGIGLAVLSGKAVNILMNSIASNNGVSEGFDLFSTPLWLVLLLVGFMLVVGLLVVFMPARRAERINPIDALRRE